MSDLPSTSSNDSERQDLSRLGPRVFKLGLIVGVLALLLGVVLAFFGGGDHAAATIGLAYLTGFAFWLSISLGALFFVAIHHLTRAGWSVTIRRLAELMAANLVTLALLALPILLGVGFIYHHWVHPPEGDALVAGKSAWLNVPFFTLRIILYFAIWIAMAWWYFRHSVAQDDTGDPRHTRVLQGYSGLTVLIFALTITFAAFDLLMSLDPHWYSTIFGVYYFAGSFLAFFSFLAIAARFLQKAGLLTHEITVEHYHDLGKWMFAFVFFWSYIAFSQYMLIWYGNIPEETAWFARRGATTHDLHVNAWTTVSVLLLFGHCLIPFPGLLSRWMKRWTKPLLFWAVWLLVFHFVDLFWIIMPETRIEGLDAGGMILQCLAALLCVIGVGGLWLAGLVKIAAGHRLVPVRDPRLHEALAFENI